MAETTDGNETAAMPVMEWRAKLTGEAFDLEDFPLWTEGCDYTVRQIDGAYFLCLPVTLVGADPGIVMDLLIQYEEQLNGIGNLLQGSYQPIRVEHSLLGHDAQGAPVSRSMRAGGVVLRTKVGMIAASGGGAAGLDSRHGAAKFFIAAAEHMDLAESALTMLSRVNLTWPELYVLAEIVQHASNSTQVEKGWIGAGELVRFKRTCGSFEILGVDARHGPQPHQAPTQPMSLNTASGLIRKMTKSWLEEVGAAAPPSPGPKFPSLIIFAPLRSARLNVQNFPFLAATPSAATEGSGGVQRRPDQGAAGRRGRRCAFRRGREARAARDRSGTPGAGQGRQVGRVAARAAGADRGRRSTSAGRARAGARATTGARRQRRGQGRGAFAGEGGAGD